MKKLNSKNKNGITLIALVLTIIVLLILAGISIMMLAGDNSILRKAGEAKEITGNAAIEEAIKMAYNNAIMNKYTSGSADLTNDMKEELEKTYGEGNVSVVEKNGKYDVTINEKIYTIDETTKEVGEKQLSEVTSISQTTLTLDGAYLLTATVSSGDAADVIWSSENENIATVTSEGIVKCGTQTGTTKIKCKGANQTLECTVTSTAKIAYTNSGSSNVRLNGGAAAYNNPTIPVGFSAIDTEYATWTQTGAQTDVNKGLVIMDNRGNQFVWIPVENAIYDSSNANASKIPTSSTKGSLNGYNYTPMAINVSGNYKGILYNYNTTGGAYLKYPSNTNYQGTSSERREPATLDDYDTDTAKPTSGLNTDKTYLEAIGLNASTFASEIQNNYDEMVNKVATYGGFYVGRYETSYDKNVSKVASIAGATSSDASKEETYRWYGLYKELRDFKNDGNVKSSMIWGSQYDAMMNWMPDF